MIYPDNFEQKTGFDEIRRMLSDRCICPLGMKLVDEMKFQTDYGTVGKALDQTMEFVRILTEGKSFPDQNYHDLREALARIKVIGTWMDEAELLILWRSLETISGIVEFFGREENQGLYPNLSELAASVAVFPAITQGISRILTKFGKLKDNASPDLYRIRMDLANTSFSISRILNGILKQAQADGYVDKDAAPTMRDGRLVLPVAPGLKRKIRGIVHDESASGKTVFIEPEEVVEANNRIRELEADERREVTRILIAFTDSIRPEIPSILESYSFMAQIDFIRAKARLTVDFDACKPVLEHKTVVDWVQAVHPLLKLSLARHDKTVVPLDIELDSRNSILLISGPNAGGKSVCLKTVGLLQYMLQCGIPVPMRPNSHAGLFKNIFIDIGDEQSIDDDLSTYSSHLINMKNMMKYADNRSLILIDEFGSGTEPNIGGAIAESVLMRFNRNRVFGIITTHYQNLKQYADSNEGIRNGAMLYDRHLMQPLYILQTGNPGSSFAVEIARKTGLPEDVIEDATRIVGRDYVNADKYLQDIVRDKRYWENKRQNVHQLEKQLDQQIEQHRQELESLQKERKSIIREAKEKADQLIQDSNAMIENTIRTIKEAQADKELTRMARQELTDFKDTLESHQADSEEELKIQRKMERIRQSQERREQRKREKNAAKPTTGTRQPASDTPEGRPAPERSQSPSDKQAYKTGDTVRLKDQTQIGEVVSVNRNDITVAFGNLTTTVKASRLEHVKVEPRRLERSKDATYISRQTREDIYNRKLAFKPDIDVRGMRGDEAIQTVMHFIDDATLIGMSRVRILHGTGNGILRNLIRQYLHTVPAVTDYHDEHVQFGGHGITVVDLG
ncbi:MAG: Smr/MutS family protein [Bacteroidaceae bacterium]|nr:Smr/MutS family protein [Bacteroidaceae bacterium]